MKPGSDQDYSDCLADTKAEIQKILWLTGIQVTMRELKDTRDKTVWHKFKYTEALEMTEHLVSYLFDSLDDAEITHPLYDQLEDLHSNENRKRDLF